MALISRDVRTSSTAPSRWRGFVRRLSHALAAAESCAWGVHYPADGR